MANTTANYARLADVPVYEVVRPGAANTARDGSGSITALVTGATNGTRIDRITFISAQATVGAMAAMVGRVFVQDAAAGNYRLRDEVALVTATSSNTAVGAKATISFPGGLNLPNGVVLGVTQSVRGSAADDLDISAEGADY